MIRIVTLIPIPMLDELLSSQIDCVPDFSLVGKASDPADLPRLLAQTHADVVLSFWDDPDHVPDVFNQLLDQFPHVLIANILWDDDTVVLYRRTVARHTLPSVGFDRLLSQIRRFCKETTCDSAWPLAAVEPHLDVPMPFFRLSLN